jgi:hypothetical protein
MRRTRLVALVAGLALTVAAPTHAQSPPPLPASAPLRFESWQPSGLERPGGRPTVMRLAASSRNRTKNALIGGAIGAAAGVVFCTAVSTLADDSADGGLSFCPLDTYLLIGAGGFLLGAAIGWVI